MFKKVLVTVFTLATLGGANVVLAHPGNHEDHAARSAKHVHHAKAKRVVKHKKQQKTASNEQHAAVSKDQKGVGAANSNAEQMHWNPNGFNGK